MQTQAKKPRSYRGDEHEWRPAEWAEVIDEALETVVDGYLLTVWRITQEVEGERQPTKRWAWQLKLTSQLSETPELVSDGESASLGGAKWDSTHRLNADRRRRYKEAKAQATPIVVPADMPADNAVERVEQAVVAQMTAPKKRARKVPVTA